MLQRRCVVAQQHGRETLDAPLMERLELVRLHRGLVLVQVTERVLGAVVVCIVVRINGLRLEACDRVELLDSRSAKPRERTKNRTLDLRNLCVLDGIHEGVLRVRGVVLQLLRRILLADGAILLKFISRSWVISLANVSSGAGS